MGYRDALLVLSESQAVTADADSTNYIDFELTTPPEKDGRPLAVWISVEAKTTAGTGIIFRWCQKVSEPSTGDADLVTVRVLAADLVKGRTIKIFLPQGVTYLRYQRLYYDIIAGAESYTLSAYLGPWA